MIPCVGGRVERNFGKSVPAGAVFASDGARPNAFGFGVRREKRREGVENTQF
jgi:hypothetical protein